MTTTTPLTVSKAKSNCMTFRIPAEKLDQLHQESATKQVSLKTLVNQIVKEYLDWHNLAPPVKLCYRPKSLLIRLVNELNEVELRVLARDKMIL